MITATYSPEDNKLRIYPDSQRLDDLLGDEYAEFKSAGYRWASKQECFVCPRWTPLAEDWALRLAGEIDDEDYSPLERSADRAERFGSYREKRRAEANQHADTFESGPSAFGHQNQNQERAERQAARHDRHRVKSVSQWSKAEYWQQRTEGVISHALYRALPDVRRGRVEELEKQIRQREERNTPDKSSTYTDSDGNVYVWCGSGRGGTWRHLKDIEAYDPEKDRILQHYKLRLSYELAMLENEGGRATDIDMVPGGFINIGKEWKQIQAVNKSPKTKRVTSVKIYTEYRGKTSLRNLSIKRYGEGCYRPPTPDELVIFNAEQAEKKIEFPARMTS